MARELLMQNNYEWVTAEGKTIETDKALNCKARNLKIEGQTYQDLIQNKFSYNGSGAWTGTFTVSRDGKYTIKTLDYNGYITLKCGGKKISKFLKSNTKYTIAFNIDTNFVNYKGVTISGEDDGYFNNSPSTNKNTRYFNDFNILMNSGYKKICFTTTSKITDYFSIGFNTTSTLSDRKVGDYFQISNIIMVEGDYTNTDLPTSINGIESVAERESKNLLENVKWYDGNINNSTGNPEPNANAIYSDLIDIDIATKYYTNIPYANGNAYRFRLYNSDGNYYKEGLTATSVDQLYSFRNSHPNIKKVRVLIFDKSNKPSQPILVPNLYTEGDVKLKSKEPWYGIRKKILVKPNTNYNLSAIIESISKGDGNLNPYIAVKSINNVNIKTLGGSGSISFNSGNNTQLNLSMMISHVTISTTDVEANFKNISVTEANLYPIKIAQSHNETDGITLPNGIKNSIENGKHIQRVGKMIVDGTNDIALNAIRDNTVRLFLTNSTVKNVNETDLPFLCDSLPKTTSCWTYDVEGIFQAKQNHRFVISISKSKLSGSTIGAVKSYFATNPMIIYYELATPITEPATITEIPLPQPLRSLPNGVRDTIEGNKLVQRVGMVVLDGSTDEEWKFESLNKNENGLLNIYIVTPNVVVKEQSEQALMCDKFPQQKLTIVNTTTEGVLINNQKRIWLRLYQSNATTVDEAKTYLSTNPITVYYELETPIEHTINVPRVPIAKGTNMVTTTNNIKPNLSMKYKKSKK